MNSSFMVAVVQLRKDGVGGQETEAGALIRGWLDSAARSPRLLRQKNSGGSKPASGSTLVQYEYTFIR